MLAILDFLSPVQQNTTQPASDTWRRRESMDIYRRIGPGRLVHTAVRPPWIKPARIAAADPTIVRKFAPAKS
jgi:hypothetical protein